MISNLPILSACALIFVIIVFRAFSNRREVTAGESSSNTEPSITELVHWPTGSPWIHRGIRSAMNIPAVPETGSPWEYNWRMTIPQGTFHRRTSENIRLRPAGFKDATARMLVENWRKSIVGLIRLADRNLGLARKHVEIENYRVAVYAAFTSTENIARALIHCCGGKPDSRPGQEEALRMLAPRFKGEERREFEKAIDSIAKLIRKRLLLSDSAYTLLNESRAEQILKSASKIVVSFKQIITTHFREEIQELLRHTF